MSVKDKISVLSRRIELNAVQSNGFATKPIEHLEWKGANVAKDLGIVLHKSECNVEFSRINYVKEAESADGSFSRLRWISFIQMRSETLCIFGLPEEIMRNTAKIVKGKFAC